MSDISLIQFEDENGVLITDVMQVPVNITVEQLRMLVNREDDLYLNGNKILESLENSLTETEKENEETVFTIKLTKKLDGSRPAFYCSGTFSGHQGPVLCTKLGSNLLVTAGGDKTIRFWDLLLKKQVKIIEKHSNWVLSIDIKDELVVSGGMDGVINLYNLTGDHIKSLKSHRNGVVGLKITDNNIVSISRDKSCIVWDLKGNIVTSWSHHKALRSFTVFDNVICTGSIDGSIKVYKDYKYLCNLEGHGTSVNCIVSNRNYIISGDDSGQIIIWKDYQPYKRLRHKAEVISLSINPNNITFVSGSFDRTVKLWDIETGKNICSYFHTNRVFKVMALNDLIISASQDRTIKTYKISENKRMSDLVCDDQVYDFDYLEGKIVCGTKSSKVHFFS